MNGVFEDKLKIAEIPLPGNDFIAIFTFSWKRCDYDIFFRKSGIDQAVLTI
jgi:hypothetical protein